MSGRTLQSPRLPFIILHSSIILSADMPDLFDFFRYALSGVVTIYASIITLQSLWGWYLWLAGTDKYISLVRRYVIVHGLRLRVRAFWGDVIICLLLSVAFCLIWRAHGQMDQLKLALDSARQIDHPPVWRGHR